MSNESVMPSDHLILRHPLLLLPSTFPSIRVFSNELTLHIRWPKYWSFSFSTSPSNDYLGLISFGIDWLDLLAVQGTLKSLLWHHNLKASILQCSAFLMASCPTYLYYVHACDHMGLFYVLFFPHEALCTKYAFIMLQSSYNCLLRKWIKLAGGQDF